MIGALLVAVSVAASPGPEGGADAGTPEAPALETVVRGERDPITTLRRGELEEVPGTLGDPLRAILLMPGVSTLASGVAYPVVRGSGPSSTGFFVDGVPVPLLFHLFVGPSVIHPELVDALELHPGAPGPDYGRLMGGTVDVRTRAPAPGPPRAAATLDVTSAGAFAAASFPSTGTSVALAGRFSFTTWLIALVANATHTALFPKQQPDASSVLAFSDYQLRVDQRLGPGTLRLLAFGAWDDYGVQAPDPRDGYLIHTAFHRADLRYLWPLGPGEAEVALTAGLDRLGYDGPNDSGFEDLGPLGTFEVITTSEHATEPSVRARASWRGRPSPGVEVSAGADADHRSARLFAHQVLEPRSLFPTDRFEGEPLERDLAADAAVGTFVGAWAQVTWKGFGPWELSTGLRADDYHLVPGIDRAAFEPRVSVRRKLTDQLTLRGAFGAFHQPPAALIGLPVVDAGGVRYGLQEGAQADAGVDWRPWRGVEVAADAYFNPLLRGVDLDIFGSGALGFQIAGPTGGSLFPRVTAVTSKGYATGLELLVRHPLGDRWFGWLSYSLQRSMRWRAYAVYDAVTGLPAGEATGWVPFAFDQTHVANAALGYSFPGGWTAGVALHLNTGRPESGVLTSRTQVAGASGWIPLDDAHVARLPAFFRVDARASRTWSFGALRLEASLDVVNVTFSSEVISYRYPSDLVRAPTGLPLVLPVLGLEGWY